MKADLYEAITTRSGGMCEAEVWVEKAQQWVRCGVPPTDVHHMLPKSRGGRILDEYGETAHLIHLCRDCHAQAHSRKDADGLMIDGSITWHRTLNRPLYRGTDPTLTSLYGLTSG